MAVRRFQSLATGLVLAACAIAVVVLGLGMASMRLVVRDLVEDDLRERTQETIGFNYQLVRFQMNRARSALTALAQHDAVRAALAAPQDDVLVAAASASLDEAMELVRFFENVALQRSTCEVVAADSAYAREAIANFFASDYCRGYGHGEDAYVSGVFTSVTTKRASVAIAVPVVGDNGTELGHIAGVIDVGDLSLYLANMQVEDGFTVVLDRYGSPVIDTRRTSDAQGVVSLAEDALLDDVWAARAQVQGGVFRGAYAAEDVVVGYQQFASDSGDFTVVSVVPWALVRKLETRLLVTMGAVAGMMVVALIAAIWTTARWSTRRLNRMTETIDRIVQGDEDERLPPEMFSSGDEVGVLGRSFNEMIDRVRDATRQLAAARAKSEAILLGIGDGVLAIDPQERIMVFNQAAERISGFSAEEVMGKPYREVLRFVQGEADDAPEVREFVVRALGGNLAVMPEHVSLLRKDGTLVPVADAAGPVRGDQGEIMGAVIVFRDVTHEREVDRMKSEFVSVASHQLRTPLTAIRWYLEDLTSEEIGPLTDDQKHHVGEASASTGRMIRLVNDLLDVSRLESGRLSVRPTPTDIAQLLADVVKEHEGIAKDKGCTLSLVVPTPPLSPIGIDPTLIRQVAANLVSNAVKYGAARDRNPAVMVTLSQDGKAYYRVEVRDNGIGIPEKAQERMFHRFFRADNALKQQTEGSGLGLYIAKLIMEASGGMIAFSSKEGEGSTFWFLLPIEGSKEYLGGKTLTAQENHS